MPITQESTPNKWSSARVRRVAYQGTAGAFGEDAVYAWRSDAEPYPVRSFAGVLDAVTGGAAHWAVIPVWNSIVGRVDPACAALDDRGAGIVRVAEVEVPVRQCLLALLGTNIDDVRYVGSHPAALGQCTRLLSDRSLVACEAYNTAGAARELAAIASVRAQGGLESAWYSHLHIDTPSRLGVIASENAARHYGLQVLLRDVQDHVNNVTRFVVLRAR